MESAAKLMPRVLAQIVKDAPLSHGKVDFAWRSSVGAATARASAVRLEGNVLLVDAQSAQWASAIMRASPIILSRLRGLLGHDTVGEIRLRR